MAVLLGVRKPTLPFRAKLPSCRISALTSLEADDKLAQTGAGPQTTRGVALLPAASEGVYTAPPMWLTPCSFPKALRSRC